MHKRPPLPRACTLLAAVALAASACSNSDADKAGGTRTKPPVVLTLADHEQGPDQVQFWIDEVQRHSGGSLRIQVTNRWRDQEFAYDKATIADVQVGKGPAGQDQCACLRHRRHRHLPDAGGAIPDRQTDPHSFRSPRTVRSRVRRSDNGVVNSGP